ncbi:chloramphenicol acetyltransferase [Lewinellaceae bacterium SD302]|nr:chloramphenicol acetyltransferase [Lewinellaceae bacterium SD302]
MTGPDPNTRFPLTGYDKLCFLKNIIDSELVEVGDYTYYDDFEDVNNFLRNIKYHFDFVGDKLIIGKFCMIASGVRFIMNGGNHLTDSFSAYPFAIFQNGWEQSMEGRSYPFKGNTVIGNDVWIGHNASIMPGITIGDGAIIATNATVTRDVAPYSVVGGNPAKVISTRFTEEIIELLLQLKWWDLPIQQITDLIPVLLNGEPKELGRAVEQYRC